MADTTEVLEKDFHHPFHPYDIQKRFMAALYGCIEDGKVGIFESPTGTGKSLSLICGSLTWLRDHKRKTFEEGLAADAADDDEPDWMLEHARQQRRRFALQARADLEIRLARIRAKEQKTKQRYENGKPRSKRQKPDVDHSASGDDEEARFVLDDYESDIEDGQGAKSKASDDSGLSAETVALMEKLGMPVGQVQMDEEAEAVDELKVFYCSRTHSQLSQFASELKRVKMPPAIQPDAPDVRTDGLTVDAGVIEEFKNLTLGSRKNLCINPKVKKLGNATAINEKCLDLQQPGLSADCKCPFLPTKKTEALVNDFRDRALATIQDIEDLGELGKRMGVCPYYASRPVIKPCEIVTLPYPLLLQKSAREALDLSLKGHVIIIDEAHNLMDAITGIYSISVSLAQLQRSRAQLGIYLQKFRNRLKGKNRVYVTQTVRLLDSLVTFLQTKSAEKADAESVVETAELMTGKGVDQINLYKLTRYLQESKLARKVDGYVVYVQQEQASAVVANRNNTAPRAEGTVPVLTHIQGFLLTLMNPSAEGRFFFTRDEDDNGVSLKYMLLDPTYQFKELVEEARAVILAGGTMSPMSDYTQHLFSYLPPDRVMTLSCGHVIPASNLCAWPVTQGLNSVEFDFTFEKRTSEAMIINLGKTIHSFIRQVPDGVVVFFPSYTYLDQCVSVWKKTKGVSHSKSIWDALEAVKAIFLESRNNATHKTASSEAISAVESTLSGYSTAIVSSPNHRGALLLSVIGGTLSEGINFSDALGRAVIVVGLPFPNPHSIEWKAKTNYITQKAASPQEGKAAAREFYENTCMRAVNQCIGRAIRHRNDYAAILLLDRRYAGDRIRAKLPGWIRESLSGGAGTEEVVAGLKKFFAEKAV